MNWGYPVSLGHSSWRKTRWRAPMRLIWDPRYPNAFLRVPRLSLEQLNTLSLLVEEMDVFLKLDMTSGYHHIMMDPKFAPYLCCRWKGRIFTWAVLPFGLATAPFIFERVMCGMKVVLRRVFHLRFMAYLDDFNFCLRMAHALTVPQILHDIRAGISTPITDIVSLMTGMGTTFGVAKVQSGHSVDMVGTQVCSKSMTFSIPPRRWARLAPLLEATIAQPVQTVRHFARMAGQFISMKAGLRHACSFLWTIHNFIRDWATQELWHKRLRAPDRLVSRCQFWLDRFAEFNGIPIRRKCDYVIRIDAAKQGAGGVLRGKGRLALSHYDRPADEQAGHNNVWEFLGSVDTILPLLPSIKHSSLQIETDNMFGRAYLRKGGGPKADLTLISETLTDVLILNDVDLVAVRYRPGPENEEADAVSRFQDTLGDWAIKPFALALVAQWIISEGLPMFNLDAFASAMNKVCHHFVSRFHELGSTFVNFFRANIPSTDFVLWVNPPFCLVGKVLLHMMRGGYTGYLIAPSRDLDRGSVWWLPLQHHARASFILPPDAFTSILTGHSRGFHAVPYQIVVYFLSFPNLLQN